MKIYLIIGVACLLLGAAGGYKLHPSLPPPKTTTDDKAKETKSSTGPVHAEVIEYSTCPPCASCNGQSPPRPTPRPPAPRASQPVPGGSVALPPALAALLQGSRAEPDSNLWTTLPPEDPSQPMIIRRTILDQGASTTDVKVTDNQTSKVTPAALPKWLGGVEVIDPITQRQILLRGGHRVFDTNLFVTGSYILSTHDWSVGGEVQF